jgi:hypothetical protein
MRLRDLFRVWVAEVIFRKQIIIVARLPYPTSLHQTEEIRRRTTQQTGYETVTIPDRSNTGVTFEFLPTARKRDEATLPSDFVADYMRNGASRLAVDRSLVDRKPMRIPVG